MPRRLAISTSASRLGRLIQRRKAAGWQSSRIVAEGHLPVLRRWCVRYHQARMEKCGADCRNVAFINEETYSGLTLDDERIRQAIIEFRPKLVVIDPIQAYLGSDSDLQIAGRARKLMHIHPLIRLFDEEYSQKNYENLCEISKDYTSRYMNKNEMSCLQNNILGSDLHLWDVLSVRTDRCAR